jgi:serine/threonine protein kinase
MTKTGTVQFSAPEIFTQSEYNEKVDVWSAGVILYMMLAGSQPFID